MEDEIFGELRAIAAYSRQPNLEKEGRDRLIRFLEEHPDRPYKDVIESLCIHFGLYPYLDFSPSIDTDNYLDSELLAIAYHQAPGGRDGEISMFHAEQARVFHKLMSGLNVILSAPTSFGKSFILDALVATGRWNNIVVIVPTIALIDEVRRRLIRYSATYDIVTYPRASTSEKTVYVLTQERFLQMSPTVDVDLFMIDEFYKLDGAKVDPKQKKIANGDERAVILNVAWDRLHRTGAQYFLCGPNITSLASSLPQEIQAALRVSDYNTVVVDVDDRSHIDDSSKAKDLVNRWDTLEIPLLIFSRSPSSAESLANELIELGISCTRSARASAIATWLAENFVSEWGPVVALGKGIGIHSGPLPRSVQRIMVRLFEEGEIDVLICTSTLIEGVNTNARTIVVYDKKLGRQNLDYFTFKNICGRAGRMRRHFVGKVLTYAELPPESPREVDIPIESQESDAPLSTLVQLPVDELSELSKKRIAPIRNQKLLPLSVIRANCPMDPSAQILAAEKLSEDADLRTTLGWSGTPSPDQLEATLNFVLKNCVASKNRSGINLQILLGRLRSFKNYPCDYQSIFNEQSRYRRKNQSPSEFFADLIRFQNYWMQHYLPAGFRAAQNIYNAIVEGKGLPLADYEGYAVQLENLFAPIGMVSLEEYGLPLPLAMKAKKLGIPMEGDPDRLIHQVIVGLSAPDVQAHFEEIELWILEDVAAGIGREGIFRDARSN